MTRTARDAASGRGADGQLYSLEILDPVRAEGGDPGPGGLRFHVPVTGTPEQLALMLRAAGRGLAVGGDRSRGFGRLRVVEADYEPTLKPIEERHRAWAEAVGRLIGLPATNLGLDHRGFIREGMFADLVVFDPATITDHATFAQPHQYATGVKVVFVNGMQVLKDGEHTGAKPGRALGGPGKAHQT